MPKRNARSFLVDKVEYGAAAGAIEARVVEGKLYGIQHSCPCGCGKLSWLPFGKGGWTPEQTTDMSRLTLTPSIGMFKGDNPYHWHGFLTNGVFEEC